MNEESISHYLIYIISLIILFGFSAFFSASETAFSSINKVKLKNMAAKSGIDKSGNGKKKKSSLKAELTLKLLDSYDKVLTTILVGNNAVNIASSALATALFIEIFGSKGIGLATLVMTILLLIFGEISPKTLAKESPELTAIRNAPLLNIFIYILTPFNFLATGWKKIITKIFPPQDRSTTDDEIKTYMEEVREEGVINSQEEKMIKGIIDLDDQKVSGIITPRIDVEAISVTNTIEEIDNLFIETGLSRFPVYEESIDNIKGIILLKDFYHEVMKGKKTLEQIIKPAVFVPNTVKIPKLLKLLQEKKSHMAIIVDEHGGTMGLVTIEDIVEELIGEIWDEHDEVVEEIKKNVDGSLIVLGGANFDDVLDALEYKYTENDEIPDTTISNWCMEKLGRLPIAGEILKWNNLSIKILKIEKHRIVEVKVAAEIRP